MNKQFFLILFLFFGMAAYSQPNAMKRVYEYDAAGNRVVRKVFELSSKQKSMDNTDEDEDEDEDENGSANKEEKSFLIDNLGDIKLKVFPNPTSSIVYIDIENVEVVSQGSITVYNAAGTQIGTQRIGSLNASVDLSSHPTGIYLVTITINGKETKWKIIKN